MPLDDSVDPNRVNLKWVILKRPSLSPLPQPRVDPRCQKELLDLFDNNNVAKTVLKKQLMKRFQYVQDNPSDYLSHTGWFEQLGHLDDGTPYYSMRFDRSTPLGNLRILFVIVDKKPHLVVAFQEKNASDYTAAKDLLIERMKVKPGGTA